MRWGLIARPETARGLGVQSYGIYENLQPDSVLIVNTDDKYDKDFKRYPGAWVTSFEKGQLNEEFVRDWLSDLDLVVAVETVYDWRVLDWARDANCRTAIQMNPEFVKPTQDLPDTIWLPTGWRKEHFPDDVRVVRVPVTKHSFVTEPDDSAPVKFLHVAGKPALADRNGTELFSASLRRFRANAEFTVTVQGHEPAGLAGKAKVLFDPSFEEIWDGQHVLVLPRRYGGNCLPVIEAIGHGMAVIMSAVEPNGEWPIFAVQTDLGRIIDMPCGPVRLHDASPVDLPAAMTTLTNKRDTLRMAMELSRRYADVYSWENMRQFYFDELELASGADYRPRSRTFSLPKPSSPDLGIITRRLQRK